MLRKALFTIWVCLSIQGEEISFSETIRRIQEIITAEEKGAYLCFSEEDIRVACGHGLCVWDQVYMEDLLSLNGDHFLKSRLLPYTALDGHRSGERWAADLFSRYEEAWSRSYAPLSSAFLSTARKKEAIRFFRFLQTKNLLIAADVTIPRTTLDLLFGPNARSILLEDAGATELSGYPVVILAVGSEEKAVALEWLEKNQPFFILDFSSLRNALADWDTKSWEKWIKTANEIKILYTSALIPNHFEKRKEEYIRSLEILKSFGYLPNTYIVESGPYTPLSFFEEYCDQVFYANTNDLSLINKGVNEAKASLAAFAYYRFKDEDMIVKLTGRYQFNDDSFLRLIASHPEVDAFASPHPVLGISTGCFAMRSKYYRRMLEEIDFADMEAHAIDVEKVVQKFLQKISLEGADVIYVEKVGITANVAGVALEQW